MEKITTWESIPFGPLAIHTKVSEEFLSVLEEDSKELTMEDDARGDLVATIMDEKNYKPENHEKYAKYLAPFAGAYLNNLMPDASEEVRENLIWFIQKIWINRQRKGEWNPPHDHIGDISFVIYLDVPEEIYREDPDPAADHLPGRFQFDTGYPMRSIASFAPPILQDFYRTITARHVNTLEPRRGDMFIFPSYLKHAVSHFNSDVERVSVAGNLYVATREMMN